MRLLLTILFSIVLKVGLAQVIPTFSKLYPDTGFTLGGGVNITNIGDTIFFSFFTQNYPETYQVNTFLKTDANGIETARRNFYKQYHYYSQEYQKNLKKTYENQLICGCEEADTTQWGGRPYLYKLNNALDSVYKVKYYTPHYYVSFSSSAQLSDSNYILAGGILDTAVTNKYSALIIKTDQNGNIIWQKELASDVFNYASFTSPFPGGFYQFWVTYHNNTYTAGADSAIFVDRYDNDGNLQWRDTFGVVGHENISGPFTATKDGGGVLVINALDTADPAIGLAYMPVVVYKFDSTGHLLWRQYLPEQIHLNSIIETSTGAILACGWGGSKIVGTPPPFVGGSFIKLDGKTGNTIFFQVYRYDSTEEDVLNDLIETSDGGYAAVGNAFHRVGSPNLQAAWLLKVDSKGCLNGDCPQIQTGIADIPNMVSFYVFPNPASSQFTIALAGSNDLGKYNDLHFTLYDLTGREIMNEPLKQQTTILQRNDIATGMYLWQIADGNNIVTNGKLVFK